MVLLSIFFFKQNTAYEMRISDWSSDVCSSDLVDRVLPRHADTGVQLERLLGGVDGNEPRVGLGHGDGHIDVLAPGGERVRRGAGGGPIGRATCRARVCQFV